MNVMAVEDTLDVCDADPIRFGSGAIREVI